MELRPLSREAAEWLRTLRNRNASRFVTTAQITAAMQQAWYARYLETHDDYMFSVYYDGVWIGAASIYHVNTKTQTAEFGRLLIDKSVAGTGGLGVDTTRAACAIALERLNIQRISLEVYCDNVAAQITYLKAGFLPTQIRSTEAGDKLLCMEKTL